MRTNEIIHSKVISVTKVSNSLYIKEKKVIDQVKQ